MRLQFVALVRKKSGTYHARKVIPTDVRDAYARLYGVKWEAKLVLPASTAPVDAKKLYGEWFADIETRIATLRAEARGEGRPLTHRDAVALCGEWRRWFVAKHEGDAPGKPSYWRNLSDTYFWEILMRAAPDEFRADPNSDPDWEWMKDPEVAAELRPVIAEAAQTALFLTSRGLALNAAATAAFVDEVQGDFPEVLNLLERRARGDYSPDETLEAYPKFDSSLMHSGSQVSPWSLFEAWVNAARPAAGTVARWNAVLRALNETHPNAAALSPKDARAWINGLITEERSARTVSDVWLPAVRRVFAWAVEQALIERNPFVGIRVTVPKQARSRETDAFTDEEIRIILQAATAIGQPTTTFAGAQRWVFWIAAYTGARAGELTQLRGIDIQQEGQTYFARLTPEAGTMKTGEARTVPLHEHLIAQGFYEFVKARGPGPLFYNPQEQEASQPDVLRPRLSRAAKARQRLGGWVRSLGIIDPELSPTHAWRDTFKRNARRAGIEEHMHDYITGHAPASIGRSYGAPTREDMSEAMKQFPRYAV